VCNREQKIEHRGILLGLIPVLLEHARAIRKGVSDGSVKIRNYALEQRACRVWHRQELVSAKICGEVRKCLVSMWDGGAWCRGQSCARFRGRMLRRGVVVDVNHWRMRSFLLIRNVRGSGRINEM